MSEPVKYDSETDTKQHIARVQELMTMCCLMMLKRAVAHDQSKLQAPEKAFFDEYTPKLKNSTYGSDEYKGFLKELQVGLKHHYENNTHHPEHYKNGVDGMSLLDVIEMFCDWKAATERHADGSIEKSIKINKDRFKMSDQLSQIFENTRKEMGW